VIEVRFNDDCFFQGVGLIDRQNLPYRVVPQGKEVIPIEGEEFKPLLA
jgi:hypothetical protein